MTADQLSAASLIVAVTSLIGTITLGVLGYRLNRQQSGERWSAELVRAAHGDRQLTIVNGSIARARRVRVELNPMPRAIQDQHQLGPKDVDRGASLTLSWPGLLADSNPSEVVVRWKRRLRREGVWRTPI